MEIATPKNTRNVGLDNKAIRWCDCALPLCNVKDVFWSEAKAEYIETVFNGPFVENLATGWIYCVVKSYSAPTPVLPGIYRLRLTTIPPDHGGGKKRLAFEQARISRIEQIAEPSGVKIWETAFEYTAGCTPKAPTLADAGRKGGKKTGRKGFAAMSKAEGTRVRKLASKARWPKAKH